MHKKKELAKNTIIIFIGKISTQSISFLLLPLYTKFLTTSSYGMVDLIATYVALLVPIISLQQDMATFRYLIDARGSFEKIKATITTSLFNIFKFLLIFIVLYFCFVYIFKIDYVYYILAYIVVCVFSNLFSQIARGLGQNVHYAIASFITGLTMIILNIVFVVVLRLQAKGMLLSIIIANLFCVIYHFFALKIYKYVSIRPNKDLKKKMIKYSLPLVPNGISWWIVTASDRTIISTFLGVAANGIYAVANKFPTIINSLFSIFSLSWTESVSLHINDDDCNKYLSDITNTVLKLFSCVCICLVSCMPFVFPFFIDDGFSDAYLYIPIFMVGVLCNCIIGVYSAVYIAKKMTKQVAMTSIVSAIINIVLNLLLINYIGLYGVCLSMSIAYFVMMIYRHIDLKKYVHIVYKKHIVIFTIIMFVISYICYYINNVYLNIICLIVVVLYSLMTNKNLIKGLLQIFASKMFNFKGSS